MRPASESETVRKKAARMARARRRHVSPWRALMHVGVLGWIFVLPLVLGVSVGRVVEVRLHVPGATVAGLLLGLAAGVYATWRQVRTSLQEGEDEDREEPP